MQLKNWQNQNTGQIQYSKTNALIVLHFEDRGGREYCTVQQACNKPEDSRQPQFLLHRNGAPENSVGTC